jgi:ribosomal protein L28
MNTTITGKLFAFFYGAHRAKSYAGGRTKTYYHPNLVVVTATSVKDIDKATATLRVSGEELRKRKVTIIRSSGEVLREDYLLDRIQKDMLLGEYTDKRC